MVLNVMAATEVQTAEVTKSFVCPNCGAALEYEIGTNKLKCSHCGTENDIAAPEDTTIYSFDYSEFIAGNAGSDHTRLETIVKCNECGASIDLPPGVTSDNCPFCASPLVINTAAEIQILKPHYVLPFAIDNKTAFASFQRWMKKLWFAPSDLVTKATNTNSRQLQGIYLPYWCYDTDAITSYAGERGDYYYTTETYTEEENGQTVTRTREVRHTLWSTVSGTVALRFQNLLISASPSLPQKLADKLQPWQLEQLRVFNEDYLSGFRSETYSISAEQGFGVAIQEMEPSIKSAIIKDIGGDEQRIDAHQNTFKNTALKYIVIPVWLSAYRYNNKLYHFMINACTGEVAGERPYSALKIFLAIILGIGIIVALYLWFSHAN